MTISAVLTVKGDKNVVAALNRLESPARKTDFLEQIGGYGVSSTQRRFSEGVDPDGKPWKPSIRAKEKGGKTLVDSNRLYQSFSFSASPSHVEWGTNVAYAGIHQFGGVIEPKAATALAFKLATGQFILAKKVMIPARAMLGINSYDEKRIYGIGIKYFEGAVP